MYLYTYNNRFSKKTRCPSCLWITGKRKFYWSERCAYLYPVLDREKLAREPWSNSTGKNAFNTLARLVVHTELSWSAEEPFYIIATVLGVCLQPFMELLEILENPIYTLYFVPAPERTWTENTLWSLNKFPLCLNFNLTFCNAHNLQFDCFYSCFLF